MLIPAMMGCTEEYVSDAAKVRYLPENELRYGEQPWKVPDGMMPSPCNDMASLARLEAFSAPHFPSKRMPSLPSHCTKTP